MGFAKAYRFAPLPQLTKPISKPAGLLWALTAVLFAAAVLLLLLKKEGWWMVGVLAAASSQALIVPVWSDAKFGTVANVVVLAAAVLAFGSWRFERSYKTDVNESLQRTQKAPASLTEGDLAALPPPVQRYLRYAGVVHRPAVQNFRVVFDGAMREKGKNWFSFASEQYNFLDRPTRLFFMQGRFFGVTVPGYHAYKNGTAKMDIRAFGLYPLVRESGTLLNRAETVTLFNDMCLLAPAALVDKRIAWRAVDDSTAAATFTVAGISVSATLSFNREGQLVNFVSNDRYDVAAKQRFRFSTPVREYRTYNGYRLPAYGEAVWHYPDGEFVYGKFWLKDVRYNVVN